MKVGLVLEGGAMRGMYSAGVLDVFMENNINIDGIIGTSAGALFGVNYFSNQKGRVIRYNKKYCNDKRYLSKRNLLFTGNIINKKFAFYDVSLKYDKFDNEAFLKTNKEYYATATDVETGGPHYFKITSPIEQLEELRASSAIPLVSRMVKIDGKKYLDGGVADSIPLNKMIELGYDKIIVVLTQPLDFVKKKISDNKIKLVKARYKKYPNLVNAMINRHNNYNEVIDKIKELEKNKEIFVIRPTHKLDVKVIERDENKLQSVYDLGRSDAKKIMKDLKSYLK